MRYLRRTAVVTEFARKYAAAMAELAGTDMWASNYAPPGLQAQHWLGFKARPPHYVPFLWIWFGYSIWFGVLWGTITWVTSWRHGDFGVLDAMGASAFGGGLFGLVMAVIYARGRRKWGLSRWDDL